MGKTKISWTDYSWNPIIGCKKVSAGCRQCYAERMGRRLAAMGEKNYKKVINERGKWTGEALYIPDRLNIPRLWKKPKKVFVCSMSDLFHESIPFDIIDKIFGSMREHNQHVYQVLTKRPIRALEYFTRAEFEPFPNLWVGVSVEDQESADQRIPFLLDIRPETAAVKFLSVEPLIGAVDLEDYLISSYTLDNLTPLVPSRSIDWVIVGGESGAGARPLEIGWIDNILELCDFVNVPVFVKQMGSHWARDVGATDPKGGDPEEWLLHHRVGEFPGDRDNIIDPRTTTAELKKAKIE